jgi:hypothetical protein
MQDLEDLAEIYSRALGILAGVAILLVSTGVGTLIVSGDSDLNGLLPVLAVLDLLAVYWILTGLKPSLTVSNLMSQETEIDSTKITALFISLFTLGFWAMMLSSGEELFEVLFLMILTSPVFIFAYHSWIGIERLEELEEELEEADEL